MAGVNVISTSPFINPLHYDVRERVFKAFRRQNRAYIVNIVKRFSSFARKRGLNFLSTSREMDQPITSPLVRCTSLPVKAARHKHNKLEILRRRIEESRLFRVFLDSFFGRRKDQSVTCRKINPKASYTDSDLFREDSNCPLLKR